jgi:hypothetical protein
LPKELQERFHYDAARGSEFTTLQEAAIADSNEADQRIQREYMRSLENMQRKKELSNQQLRVDWARQNESRESHRRELTNRAALPLFQIARVLVRVNHVASRIVNADHGVMVSD